MDEEKTLPFLNCEMIDMKGKNKLLLRSLKNREAPEEKDLSKPGRNPQTFSQALSDTHPQQVALL